LIFRPDKLTADAPLPLDDAELLAETPAAAPKLADRGAATGRDDARSPAEQRYEDPQNDLIAWSAMIDERRVLAGGARTAVPF
jgi:hypothetical protein